METDDVFSPVYVNQILEAKDLIIGNIMSDTGTKNYDGLHEKIHYSRNVTKSLMSDWLAVSLEFLHKFAAPVLANAAKMYNVLRL